MFEAHLERLGRDFKVEIFPTTGFQGRGQYVTNRSVQDEMVPG